MAVTNTWTNPTALDRNTGQTIREQDWDGVLSDLMVLGGSNGSSGVSKYNLLTNGGFEIWQRGNGPFTGNGTWTADRWSTFLSGTDTMSVSRDTTNIASGSVAAAAVVFTKGTGTNSSYNQSLENAVALRSQVVSLSIRVRTTVANAVRPYITTVTGTRQYGSYHTGGGGWETLTVTATIDPASTVCGPAVEFNASCTAYIDNAMLVVGSVAADYAPLHPADDLARCQRYYEVWIPTNLAYAAMGSAYLATNMVAPFFYKVTKAVTPVVTLAPASNWSTSQSNASNTTATAVSSAQIGVHSCNLNMTVPGSLGIVSATPFQALNAAAVITMEANP